MFLVFQTLHQTSSHSSSTAFSITINMHLKQALIATAFGTVVIASPLDIQPRAVPQNADFYNVINLDDFDLNANNGTLEKRVDWAWCTRTGNKGKPKRTPAT